MCASSLAGPGLLKLCGGGLEGVDDSKDLPGKKWGCPCLWPPPESVPTDSAAAAGREQLSLLTRWLPTVTWSCRKITGRVDGWGGAIWDKVFLNCWCSFSAYLHEEICRQNHADLVSFSRDSCFEVRESLSILGCSGFKLWLLNQGKVLLCCRKCSSGELCW